MRLLTGWNVTAGNGVTAGGEPSDRGSAIVAVVAFGMLALLAIGNVVGGIVVEHRAVEDNLAQTRFYWAAMGHANYLLSRTGGSGLCLENQECDKPSNMASNSKVMLAEIQSLEIWQYPELGSVYRFRVHPSVVADPRAPSGAKGRLMFEAHFHAADGTATQNLQALRTVSNTRPIEMRYCLTKDLGEAICDGNNKDAKVTWIGTVHRPVVDPNKP